MNKKKLLLTLVLVGVIVLEVIALFAMSNMADTTGSGNVGANSSVIDASGYHFGEYPQTLKAENVTVGSTADYRGYYYGSDGAYYVKVVATPYGNDYTFSNGLTIVKGTEYYFKVEPIRWRVIEKGNGEVTLMCDGIIANRAFDEHDGSGYSNNYAESSIREWMNGTFFYEAFSVLEQERILNTEVDNSAASTGDMANEYACANTTDKVYLPSYAELVNGNFKTQMTTSDYSRATGAYMNTGSHFGCGWWWTRSPYTYGAKDAHQVSYDGGVGAYVTSVGGTSRGVVPVLRIRMD